MLRVLNQLPDKALLRQLAQALELKLMTGQSPLHWLRGQPYIPVQLVVFLQKVVHTHNWVENYKHIVSCNTVSWSREVSDYWH